MGFIVFNSLFNSCQICAIMKSIILISENPLNNSNLLNSEIVILLLTNVFTIFSVSHVMF